MTKQAKNYIVFLGDESGSMASLRAAAMRDQNTNMEAVKAAASNTMQDTIVSFFGFGGGEVRRYVQNSNPHVLQPLTSWEARGGTPGRKAIKEAIDMLKAMPDYGQPNIAYVLSITTDGEFDSDGWGSNSVSTASLGAEIAALLKSERWTIVFRVPRGGARHLAGLNIPAGNIQEWDTTAAGMAVSTEATKQAFDQFYATRATGKTSSTVFYANAAAVDTSKLADVSNRIKLYVVEAHENGKQIRDFILARRSRYLKGSAFYQLTKTEPRVGPNKMIAIRDRASGKIYAGKDARSMLGLSSVDNIRLHPGDHGNYDLFIQSESVNRKLVASTGVLYWEEIGTPFTQEEIDRFTQPAAPKPAAPSVVVLPKVTPTNKPTPSPLKAEPISKVPTVQVAAPTVNGRPVKFARTREQARNLARQHGKRLEDLNNYVNAIVVSTGRIDRFFIFA